MSYSDIIPIVRNIPVLWQPSHPFYGDRVRTRHVWQQLAKDLNADEKVIRKNWRDIKSKYRQCYMRAQEISDLDCGDYIEDKIWKHYKDLSFLKEWVNMRNQKEKQFSKYYIESSYDVDTEASSSSDKMGKYKNSTPLRSNFLPHNDPDYMFLMSVLPSSKNWSEIKKLQFRRRVSHWLLETFKQNQLATSESADPQSNIYLQTEHRIKIERNDSLD